MKKWLTCSALLLTWSVSWSAPIRAQAVTTYEVAITAQGSTTPLRTLVAPAVQVACVTGTLPANQAVWFAANDTVKVVFNPDPAGTTPARACTWTGPVVSTLALAPGTLYTSTVTAVADLGGGTVLRSSASPASNPFGLPTAPPTPSAVVVTKG